MTEEELKALTSWLYSMWQLCEQQKIPRPTLAQLAAFINGR